MKTGGTIRQIQQWVTSRSNLIQIVFNTGWLAADKALRMSIGLFVGVWIARYLGPSEYGYLNYAISFVAIFSAIANFGIDSIVVRDIVLDKSASSEILGSAFALKILGSLLTIIVTISVAYVLYSDQTVLIILIILFSLANIFRASEVIDLWFQSLIQSKYPVFAGGFSFLTFSMIKILLILTGATLLAFGFAILAEAILTAIALLFIYFKQGGLLSNWK